MLSWRPCPRASLPVYGCGRDLHFSTESRSMNSSDIKAILQQFGPPAYENAKGELSRLNENFWAAYYSKGREQIIVERLKQALFANDFGCDGFCPQSFR